mgnify:CR=1 FL=1
MKHTKEKDMRKGILGALTLLVMVFCLPLTGIRTEAAGPRDGEIVDGSLLTSDTEATASFENQLRSGLLARGFGRLINRGNGVVDIEGETSCHQTCDRVRVYLYLEKLVGNDWEPVVQKTATARNYFFVETSETYSLETGAYYRLRGTYSASKGTDAESRPACTDGIYLE